MIPIGSIVNPSSCICNHLPVYGAICRYIALGGGLWSPGDHAMADAEGPDGVPGHFPQLLPRAPNAAGLLYGAAQVGFVPCDSHADEVMVVSPRLSCAPAPWHLLDDKFHRFQTPFQVSDPLPDPTPVNFQLRLAGPAGADAATQS